MQDVLDVQYPLERIHRVLFETAETQRAPEQHDNLAIESTALDGNIK
jgi:hypothetical protein